MSYILENSSSVIYALIVLSTFASIGYAFLFYGFMTFSQPKTTSLVPLLEFKIVSLVVYLYTLILSVVQGWSYWKGINDGQKNLFQRSCFGNI